MERRVKGLAALILVANVVGLSLSLVAGDPRLMLAKDSGITATVGLAVLVSVLMGRPLMTVALKPWVTKGNPVRDAVWERLIAEQGWFARMERMFSVLWGVALFGEAAVRSWGRTRFRSTPWCGWVARSRRSSSRRRSSSVAAWSSIRWRRR